MILNRFERELHSLYGAVLRYVDGFYYSGLGIASRRIIGWGDTCPDCESPLVPRGKGAIRHCRQCWGQEKDKRRDALQQILEIYHGARISS